VFNVRTMPSAVTVNDDDNNDDDDDDDDDDNNDIDDALLYTQYSFWVNVLIIAN